MIGPVAPAQAQRSYPVDALRWLSGCWEGRQGATTIEEQWTLPRAGTLLGTARTTDTVRTRAFEYLHVFSVGDTIVYAATPSGQQRAEFRGRVTTANEIVFENPAHDFPQRIGYRRHGDSLSAFIEGPRGGTVRRIPYSYRRVPCGS
jgi:hypothetical protein